MADKGQSGGEDRHVPFGIFVRGTDHLREVYDDRLAGVAANKNVELVVVAVDESGSGEADDNIHKFRVEFSWRRNFIYLTSIVHRENEK